MVVCYLWDLQPCNSLTDRERYTLLEFLKFNPPNYYNFGCKMNTFPIVYLILQCFFLFVVNIDYDKNEDTIFGGVQSAESDYSANESDEVCTSSSFNYCLQFASWQYLSYDLT